MLPMGQAGQIPLRKDDGAEGVLVNFLFPITKYKAINFKKKKKKIS